MNYFFTLHSFLEVGKTQDLPSKFWQTLGDALNQLAMISHNDGIRGILLYELIACPILY
jgi:hypothetical protein